MARQDASARNLTLTEELERLEQSITLTLQEIDQNFSKAHRIVTTSIIPLVEQYGEHSRGVWEASKFWKQFFEASANVSLSGYEDLANDNDTTADESTMRDDTTADYTDRDDDRTTGTAAGDRTLGQGDDSILDNGDVTGSTPRAPATRTIKTHFSSHQSPYEALRREMRAEAGEPEPDEDEEESTMLVQHRTALLPDMSMTPRSSTAPPPEQASERPKDRLLHRVLDKNYRLQATPHKFPHHTSPQRPSPAGRRANAWDDSPMSSPEMAIPKLRSEAFLSPLKTDARQRLASAIAEPRTPGRSVQTPATGRKARDVFGANMSEAEGAGASTKEKYEIDWESDSDDGPHAAMSPPKTIQFALPPSKLMQTPAREASKKIVANILMTAGAEPESSEYSPTVVRMNEDILNESF